MATGDWTVYTSTDADTLATALKTASVVVADTVQITKRGGTFFAFVCEA